MKKTVPIEYLTVTVIFEVIVVLFLYTSKHFLYKKSTFKVDLIVKCLLD